MRLLYFAWLREKAGINSEEVNPPSEVTTVADLIEWLKARGGGHAEAFADQVSNPGQDIVYGNQ